MKKINIILLFLSIIVLIGNYLDAITTYVALQENGTYETVHSMNYIINKFGWVGFFFIKFVIVTYFILFYKKCFIPFSRGLIIKYFPQYKWWTEKILIMLILVTYVYLGYTFWSVSFSNLKFIL